MKISGIALLAVAASTAALSTGRAAILFNTSNITTGVGNGLNGANTSVVASNASASGFSSSSVIRTSQLAEDFTLSSTSAISVISFDAYIFTTYSFPPLSPFTGATVSIWNAQPGTAGASVLFTSNTLSVAAWTGVYRVTSTTLTDATRPVFSLSMSFTNTILTAGTYWASFAVTGITTLNVYDSIFTPPVMNADGTLPVGNAIRSADGGATWIAATDTTAGYAVRFPLTVASPVPRTGHADDHGRFGRSGCRSGGAAALGAGLSAVVLVVVTFHKKGGPDDAGRLFRQESKKPSKSASANCSPTFAKRPLPDPARSGFAPARKRIFCTETGLRV